jgi:hypothetical protein
MMSRTPIGGLLLENVEGWTFHVQPDGTVAGRYGDDSGLLRIFIIPPNHLDNPVTHEQCLAFAQRLADVSEKRASSRQMMQSISGPFGSAYFERADELVRIWYCNRAPGLVIGIYTCSIEASRTSGNRRIARQCAHTIGSAIFDRPSWGGDDELTRFLQANLTCDDPSSNLDFPP